MDPEKPSICIGRENCDVLLRLKHVSKKHAMMEHWCVWKEHSFCASPCPAVQQQKLRSRHWFGALCSCCSHRSTTKVHMCSERPPTNSFHIEVRTWLEVCLDVLRRRIWHTYDTFVVLYGIMLFIPYPCWYEYRVYGIMLSIPCIMVSYLISFIQRTCRMICSD